MLQIEWKSSVSRSYAILCKLSLHPEKHYHSDGRRRSRPKASTVHGWLVKWRATFSGNERLRKEGIREMREAKATRECKKQQKAARRAKAKVVSKYLPLLWPISFGGKERQSQAQKESQHSSSRHPSRESTRRLTCPNHSPRPTPASRRPSHNRKATGDRNPPSSRKASYNSRGDIVRTAEKKR